MYVSNRIGYDVDQVFTQVMENLCQNYVQKSNLKDKIGSYCHVPFKKQFENFMSKITFCVPKKKNTNSTLENYQDTSSEIIQ